MSCRSRDACVAVGVQGKDGPLVVNWNGSRWSIARVPIHGALNAVSCNSAVSCVAVGLVGTHSLVLRSQGERWHRQASADVHGPAGFRGRITTALRSVACWSATGCAAVGTVRSVTTTDCGDDCPVAEASPTAEAWNGQRWLITRIRQSPSPTGTEFSSVSCVSRSSCTAVGPFATSAAPPELPATLAEHWAGNSWKRQRTPNPPGVAHYYGGTLYGASCSSTSQCMAVGSFSFAAIEGETVPLAERWTGLGWKPLPTPIPGGDPERNGAVYLTGVSCTSSSACTAVGQSATTGDFNPLVERWDGSSWVLQPTPRLPGTEELYPGGVLNAVACISGSDCFAVGTTRNVSLVERWNGSSWSVQNTPTPPSSQDAVLNAIACPTSTTCFAVGSYAVQAGTVSQTRPLAERWDGTTWTIEAVPGSDNDGSLAGLSCEHRPLVLPWAVAQPTTSRHHRPLSWWSGGMALLGRSCHRLHREGEPTPRCRASHARLRAHASRSGTRARERWPSASRVRRGPSTRHPASR